MPEPMKGTTQIGREREIVISYIAQYGVGRYALG